ncbi:MAG TPA: primosomal protein N' [Clostridia bacterium]|nr:primosomal protein N' [Clostridia bacterium]
MIYEVIVDISNGEVDRVFDYFSEEEYPLGCRVLVPFGNRVLEGFIFGTKDTSDVKTKEIIGRLDDFTAISEEMLALAKFFNEKNNLRLVDILRLCIPSKLRGGKVRQLKKAFVTLCAPVGEAKSKIKKNAVNQLRVIDALANGGEYESELNARFGSSSVKSLLEKGIIERELVKVSRTPYKGMVGESKKIELTAAQKNAVKTILGTEDKYYLVHGVTGSGKTEIYMTVISEVISKGKTAIMLVPEISLTPQMLGAFRERFGDRVAVLHSGLGGGERFDEWLRLLNGEAVIALGARSAIFAPVKNVGAIIIDEEHDTSYISESNPRYFTEDIAKFRAGYNNAKLILGSATPSLITYSRAQSGQYRLISLPERVKNREMPDMEIIDMRDEVRAGNTGIFSRALLSELEKTINAGNQAMLFINRRGFSSFVRCRQCGYIPMCGMCDVSLTYHKDENRLKCHYCGQTYHMLTECPKCHSTSLATGRIGTERVVEEVKRVFPDVNVLRMDLDTTSTKEACAQILSAFARKEAQVLVGTQMIVKGHDFSDVTLVGVLDADLSLYFSDFRSNENTFQLITQVAGRAGREEKPGRVVIQTYNPKHYVFRFARGYDYTGFFEKEINIREATRFPPFSKIVRILIKSAKEEKAIAATRRCYEMMRDLDKSDKAIFRVKAMRAPIKKINGEYRFQIVVWVEKDAEDKIIPRLYEIAAEIDRKDVVTFVEINPTQMT